MPRLKNRIPKLGKKRRGDATYAVVRLNNRIHVCGRWGSKEADQKYKALLTRWIQADCSPGVDATPKTVTVSQLCAAFWAAHKPKWTPATRTHFRLTIAALRKAYGPTLVSEFGGKALKALRDGMVSGDVTRKYVNQRVGRVKQIFKWGVSEDMVPPDVHARLVAVVGLRAGDSEAVESEGVKPVPMDVFEATLEFLPEVLQDMLRVQLYTGARPGEICELTPGQVETGCDPWEYRPAQHKNKHRGKGRVIFIGPRGQEILRRYLLRGDDERCFRPVDSEKKRREKMTDERKTPAQYGNAVGTNRRSRPKMKPGDAYNKDSLNRAVSRAIAKLNETRVEEGLDPVERWSPNQLRHSAGTLVRARFGLEHAQVVLGHSKADTTQIYAEADLAKAREVIRQIG